MMISLGVKDRLKKLGQWIRNAPRELWRSIRSYRENYRKGVEKYGVWWTIFTLSMWSLITIFIGTTLIVLFYYLPRTNIVL